MLGDFSALVALCEDGSKEGPVRLAAQPTVRPGASCEPSGCDPRFAKAPQDEAGGLRPVLGRRWVMAPMRATAGRVSLQMTGRALISLKVNDANVMCMSFDA